MMVFELTFAILKANRYHFVAIDGLFIVID